jgi:hypothetical protein
VSLVLSGSALANHKDGEPHGGGGGNPPGGATLGDLSCSESQVAKFDGTNWICAADDSGLGFLVMGCTDGNCPLYELGEPFSFDDRHAHVMVPLDFIGMPESETVLRIASNGVIAFLFEGGQKVDIRENGVFFEQTCSSAANSR